MLTHLKTNEDGGLGPSPPPHCPLSIHSSHTPHSHRHLYTRTQSHTQNYQSRAHTHTYIQTHTRTHPHTVSKTPFSGGVELCLTYRAGEDETQGVGHSAIGVHVLVAVNHEPTIMKGNSN